MRRIIDYPNLWGYTRDLYQVPGVAETVSLAHIKRHYYASHAMINPTRIVPKGPAIDLPRRTSARGWPAKSGKPPVACRGGRRESPHGDDSMLFKGQVALITGAGRGIGKAIALAFAREGANIAFAEIDSESARGTAKEIARLGRKVIFREVDIGDCAEAQRWVADVARELGRIDIMVNNAGVAKSEPFLEVAARVGRTICGCNCQARSIVRRPRRGRWRGASTAGSSRWRR